MDIRPLRTEADYDWAIGEIGRLWLSPPGTPDGDRLDVLLDLTELWARKHLAPAPPLDPIDVLRTLMEDGGRTQADLAAAIGSRSRASELLSGKRKLTPTMIRRISLAWNLPADVLIDRRPYLASAA